MRAGLEIVIEVVRGYAHGRGVEAHQGKPSRTIRQRINRLVDQSWPGLP
jgi:hypothetical protein